MNNRFDVDIDLKPTTDKNQYGVPAIKYVVDKKQIVKHPSGHYMPEDNMPVDMMTGWATIDYKEAEERGFIKVDLLTNNALTVYNSKGELLESINKEPDWTLLQDENTVKALPHIGNHVEILQDLKPQSIEDLADVLALIRPAKIKFIDDYKKNKLTTRENLYRKPKTGYYFKKSHAVAYAIMIVGVLNSKNCANLVEW